MITHTYRMTVVASFLQLSLLPELHDVVETLRDVFWNMAELRNVVDKALLLRGNRIQLAKSLVHGLQLLILILVDHAVDDSQRVNSSILRSLANQSSPFRLPPWDYTGEEPQKQQLARTPCAGERPGHGALRYSHNRRMWPHDTYSHGQRCSPYGKHGDTSNRWNTWRLDPGSNKTGKVGSSAGTGAKTGMPQYSNKQQYFGFILYISKYRWAPSQNFGKFVIFYRMRIVKWNVCFTET